MVYPSCPPRPGQTPLGSHALVAVGEEPNLGCGATDACVPRFVSGKDGPGTVPTDWLTCVFCRAEYRDPKLAASVRAEVGGG